jgi:hypothetical protein
MLNHPLCGFVPLREINRLTELRNAEECDATNDGVITKADNKKIL